MPSMLEADWRNVETYRALLGFERAAFAWEFLRRNPGYASAAGPLPTLDPRHLAPDLLAIDAPAGGAAQWGLLFPRKARP